MKIIIIAHSPLEILPKNTFGSWSSRFLVIFFCSSYPFIFFFNGANTPGGGEGEIIEKAVRVASTLRKQPTFRDATNGFRTKWRLLKRAQKFHTDDVSLLPLIGRKFCFSQSEALPRSGLWRVISLEFLHSFLRRHFARKQLVASRNVDCFIKLELGWVIEQDFPWNFPVNFRWVFAFFSLACLTESCSFGYDSKDNFPCSSYILKLSTTVRTSDVTSGTKDESPHGRFKSEWDVSLIATVSIVIERYGEMLSL